MSNQLTIPGAAPTYLTEYVSQEDAGSLAAGIQASFATISIRGKVFRTKVGGVETPITYLDGPMEGQPQPFLDVVILAANDKLSKTYYVADFQEGMDVPPDCASENGIVPDPSIAEPQNAVCATCPQNVWGSAISKTTGKPVKACQDSKRVAVVPASQTVDMSTVYMLNIPAATLKLLVEYSTILTGAGRPFNGVVTRISFDIEAAYPLLKFQYVRDLTPQEFAVCVEEAKKPETDLIIGKSSTVQQPQVQQPPVQQPQVQQPPVQQPQVQQPPVQQPQVQQPPVQQPQVQQPPVQQPQVDQYGLGPDSDGNFWDPEKHSSGRTKTSNGKWRAKAKRGAATVQSESSTQPQSFQATEQPQSAAVEVSNAPEVPEVSDPLAAELDDILSGLAL